MKCTTIILWASLLLLACKPTEPTNLPDSTRTTTHADTQNTSTQSELHPTTNSYADEAMISVDSFGLDPEFTAAKGILIGNSINIYGTNTQIVERLKEKDGTVVEILAKTPQTFSFLNKSQNEICDQYPFVQVKLDNKTVWIFGAYVYKISEQALPNIASADYELVLCHNFGAGASNNEGLTGCDDFSPLLLKKIGTDSYKLLEMSMGHDIEENFHDNFPYYNLISDEGTGESISHCESTPKGLEVHIEVSHQASGAEYDLSISHLEAALPTATISNYHKIEE
jgi:hypothetical protein